MPLTGTLCCQSGNPESFQHCTNEAHEGRCQHSIALLAAMSKNSPSREGITFSPSTLSTCPRWQVLSEKNDYYEAPSDYYKRWLGAGTHSAIAMSGPYEGITQETRFYRDISIEGDKFTVSGQIDWFDQRRQHLEDFKRVSYIPKQLRADHEAQANVYVWILAGNEIPVRTASVRYLGNNGEEVKPVPLWSEEAVESYIRTKLWPVAVYHQDGNLAKLHVSDSDKWKAAYCPFKSDHNPGRCCMASEAKSSPVEGRWDVDLTGS